MSLFDIYKVKRIGLISQDSLFASSLGKNLKPSESFNKFDEVWESGYIDTVDGVPKSSSIWARSKNYISALPNTEYYIYSSEAWYTATNMCFYDSDYNYLGYTSIVSGQTFKTLQGTTYMKFYAYKTDKDYDTCINISKTEGSPKNGDYVPYSG